MSARPLLLGVVALAAMGCTPSGLSLPEVEPADSNGACLQCDDAVDLLDPSIPAELAILRIWSDAVREHQQVDLETARRLLAFTRGTEGPNAKVTSFMEWVALTSGTATKEAAADRASLANRGAPSAGFAFSRGSLIEAPVSRSPRTGTD